MPAAAIARRAARSIVIDSPFCILSTRRQTDVAPSNGAPRLPGHRVPCHALRPNSDHRCWRPVSTEKYLSSRYFRATGEDFLPFHANSRGLRQFLLPDRETPLPPCGYQIESSQVSRVGLDPEHDTGDEPDGSRIFGEHCRRARSTEAQVRAVGISWNRNHRGIRARTAD